MLLNAELLNFATIDIRLGSIRCWRVRTVGGWRGWARSQRRHVSFDFYFSLFANKDCSWFRTASRIFNVIDSRILLVLVVVFYYWSLHSLLPSWCACGRPDEFLGSTTILPCDRVTRWWLNIHLVLAVWWSARAVSHRCTSVSLSSVCVRLDLTHWLCTHTRHVD